MNSQGFAKESRLLSKRDFSRLKSGSNSIKGHWLMAYYKPNDKSLTRLGVAVSKKTANAVGRNKIKRQVRESFRTSSFRDLGVDILFVAHPNILKKSGDLNLRIRRSLDSIFKSIDSE